MCRMERAIKKMSRKRSRCSSGAEVINSPDLSESFLQGGGDYMLRKTQLSKISEGDETAFGSTIRSDTKSLLEGRSWVMDTGRSDLLRSNLVVPRSYTPTPPVPTTMSTVETPGVLPPGEASVNAE